MPSRNASPGTSGNRPNPELFVKDGSSVVFHLPPGETKKKLNGAIKRYGGQITSRRLPHIICVADEKLWTSKTDLGKSDCIWPTYIVDCIKTNSLLDMDRYKCRSGARRMRKISLSELDDDDKVMSEDSFDMLDDLERPSTTVSSERKGRIKYSEAEDLNIIKYIVKNREHGRTKGIALWRHMQKVQVTPHSASSMMTHYRDVIIKRLDMYDIPSGWRSLLTGNLSLAACESDDTVDGDDDNEKLIEDGTSAEGADCAQPRNTSLIVDEGEDRPEVDEADTLREETAHDGSSRWEHDASPSPSTNPGHHDNHHSPGGISEDEEDELDRQLMQMASSQEQREGGFRDLDPGIVMGTGSSPRKKEGLQQDRGTRSKGTQHSKGTEFGSTAEGAAPGGSSSAHRYSPREEVSSGSSSSAHRHSPREEVSSGSSSSAHRHSPREEVTSGSSSSAHRHSPREEVTSGSSSSAHRHSPRGEVTSGSSSSAHRHSPRGEVTSGSSSSAHRHSPMGEGSSGSSSSAHRHSPRGEVTSGSSSSSHRHSPMGEGSSGGPTSSHRHSPRGKSDSRRSHRKRQGSQEEDSGMGAKSRRTSRAATSPSPQQSRSDAGSSGGADRGGNKRSQDPPAKQHQPVSNDSSKSQSTRRKLLPLDQSNLKNMFDRLSDQWVQSGEKSEETGDRAKGGSESYAAVYNLVCNSIDTSVLRRQRQGDQSRVWSQGQALSRDLEVTADVLFPEDSRPGGQLMAKGCGTSDRGHREQVSQAKRQQHRGTVSLSNSSRMAENSGGDTSFTASQDPVSDASADTSFNQEQGVGLNSDGKDGSSERNPERQGKRIARSMTALGVLRALSTEFELTLAEAATLLCRNSGHVEATRHWIIMGDCLPGHHYWLPAQDRTLLRHPPDHPAWQGLEQQRGLNAVLSRIQWLKL